MATGDLIEFGSLLMNGAKQLFPTRPWRTDTTPPGAPGVGNIPHYTAGATVAFGNSDANSAYNIKCREVNIDGKKLLIPTSNLLVNISHDDLNALGFVAGKEYVIDGKKVLARLLTGGSDRRNGDYYAGGTPANNEWDRIISNEAGLSGIPTPVASDLDNTQNATDFNSAHNKFWNWFYAYSWAKETYAGSSAARVCRGSNSARGLAWNASSTRDAVCGFRPAFEVLDSAPLISATDANLGNKTSPLTMTYSVTEPEGQNFSVVEKLNGVQIGSVTNVPTLSNRQIKLTIQQWNSLSLNVTQTLSIEATDSAGNKSIRRYTFIKTNAAPAVTIVEPKGDLANLAIVDTLTPVLVHQFSDADAGDSQSAFQCVIEDTNGSVIHDTGKILSAQSFFQVPSGLLSWGTRLKFKTKVWDKYDVPSEFTAYEFFIPNRAPNVTDVQPGSSDIDNPAGAGTAPEFTWTFEDLDLESQVAYQLEIFNTSDVVVLNTSKVYKNITKHKVVDGVLTDGAIYYAKVTVWDPNGLSNTSAKAYFRTNATPTAPFITGPTDNYRTTLSPTFSAIVGTDPEDDGQHFMIEISENAEFSGTLLKFRSDDVRTGWKVNNFDIPVEGVFNAQSGNPVSYELQVALDKNKKYFWRMYAIDASTRAIGVPSVARKIRAGNKLEFKINNPIKTMATAARRILLAADYNLPKDGNIKSTMKVEVSNNALDVSPTWEDATSKFIAMDYYNFTNATKTATEFAIGIRITIVANDSMEPIYVDALGLTFD